MKVIIDTYSTKYDSQVRTLISEAIKVLNLPTSPGHDKDLDTIDEIYIGRGRFFLALIKEKVIGVVGLQEIDAHMARLKRMYVLSTYQGRGIGQLLFNTLLKFAREQRYQEIILTTHTNLKIAQRFYEKNGFEATASQGDVKYYKLKLSK